MSDSSNTENALALLLSQLANDSDTVAFEQVIDVINAHYDYTPMRFFSGEEPDQRTNDAGSNEISCKVFAFAQLQNLDVNQTLNCFGDYYRVDVLPNPEGTDHGNIRNFERSGWAGIKFDGEALKIKSSG
jgi:hypothetical protein